MKARYMNLSLIVALNWSFTTTIVFAQSTVNCNAIKSDKDRLACFDAADKGIAKSAVSDAEAFKKASAFIRQKMKNAQVAQFSSATRAMRSNGMYTMDTVCGIVNGMGYFYWVEKNDGGIDDGSMVQNIGYGIWCKGNLSNPSLPVR